MKTLKYLSYLLLFINFTNIKADNHPYDYFLQTYEKICSMPDNNSKKIQELNVLQAQIDSYYEGLPSTSYPERKLIWIALYGIAANYCLKDSIVSYCFYMATAANALAFCYEASNYTHNYNKTREFFARLESLQAAIQERLDQNKHQS